MARVRVNRSFVDNVAVKFGMPAALIFSRIDWSSDDHRQHNESKYFIKNEWWMYDTAEGFQAEFPWLSISTIKRAVSALIKARLITHLRVRAKTLDQTNFYAINLAEFKKLECQNESTALSLVYKFEAIEKLKHQIDTLAIAGEKARVSKWTDASAHFDTMHGVKMTLCSLSTNLPPSLNSLGGGGDPPNPPKPREEENGIGSESRITIIKPIQPPEPPDRPQSDLNPSGIGRHGEGFENELKPHLNALGVWRVFTSVRLSRQGLLVTSPTSSDLAGCEKLLADLKTEEKIAEMAERFFSIERHRRWGWPISFLVKDLVEIAAMEDPAVAKNREAHEKSKWAHQKRIEKAQEDALRNAKTLKDMEGGKIQMPDGGLVNLFFSRKVS